MLLKNYLPSFSHVYKSRLLVIAAVFEAIGHQRHAMNSSCSGKIRISAISSVWIPACGFHLSATYGAKLIYKHKVSKNTFYTSNPKCLVCRVHNDFHVLLHSAYSLTHFPSIPCIYNCNTTLHRGFTFTYTNG